VNEAGRCVPIPHLGWDLTLVRDEQRAGEGRVFTECMIYRTTRVRSDSRQETGWLARSFCCGDRKVGRRTRRSDDRGARKDEDEPRPIRPLAR